MNNQLYILVFCCVGTLQGFVLSTYLLTFNKVKRTSHSVILGLLLMAISIRVAKSTLYLMDELPNLVMNIGFAAHLAIGPLLLLYIQSYQKNNGIKRWLNALHFVPVLLALVFSGYLTESNFWLVGGYTWTLILSVFYFPVIAGILIIKKEVYDEKPWWFWGISITVFGFLFAYFANYILRITNYSTAPAISAGLLYFISFIFLKHIEWFSSKNDDDNTKYKHINLTDIDLDRHVNSIYQSLSHDQPYLNGDFSLTDLSKLTGIQSHVLSYVISEKLNSKFTDLINQRRIEQAKQMILQKDYFKISSIATDCGFNSLSSFNAAFKKFTGKTPTAFRQSHQRETLS